MDYVHCVYVYKHICHVPSNQERRTRTHIHSHSHTDVPISQPNTSRTQQNERIIKSNGTSRRDRYPQKKNKENEHVFFGHRNANRWNYCVLCTCECVQDLRFSMNAMCFMHLNAENEVTMRRACNIRETSNWIATSMRHIYLGLVL